MSQSGNHSTNQSGNQPGSRSPLPSERPSNQQGASSAGSSAAGAPINPSPDPSPTRLAGQMGFPDSMPHAERDDGYLINDRGERVPPMRQNGQGGSNDITWHAGKPIIEQVEPKE